jgi:PPOX class probable F420-dependent enzyme
LVCHNGATYLGPRAIHIEGWFVFVCHHAGHSDWLSSAAKENVWAQTTHESFVASNHRAVLVTRRSGGGLQTSPVLVGVDGQGRVVISAREGAYKTRNLRRDPTVVLCVVSDRFFGRWMQIEGTAQVVSLPEAMEGAGRLLSAHQRGAS